MGIFGTKQSRRMTAGLIATVALWPLIEILNAAQTAIDAFARPKKVYPLSHTPECRSAACGGFTCPDCKRLLGKCHEVGAGCCVACFWSDVRRVSAVA